MSSGELHFSWSDLLWAAITIGRPNTAYVFRHGDASLHEALFRLSLIRMALEQVAGSNRLFRTDALRALDPTEKGAVSYFLGMAACKLFATQLLGTPWLLHLDIFKDQLNVRNLGRSRPDLVGEDANGLWHAFETKGRSSVPTEEDKVKAKSQAQRLVSVGGVPCSLHVGALAFFRNEELEFYWRDPDPQDPSKLEPVEFEVSDDDWSYYYSLAVALAGREDLLEPSTASSEMDIKVEIHPKIDNLLNDGLWSEARAMAIQLSQALKEEGFQPDGLRIIAGSSWSNPSEFSES